MHVRTLAGDKLVAAARSRRRSSRRGMAFVATMLVLFLVMATILIGIAANNISSTGSGLMSNVNNGVASSNARISSASAFDLAETGLEYTMQWFYEQPSPPDPYSGKSFCPWGWGQFPTATSNTSRAVVNFGSGSFSVMIYPDQANYNDSSNDMAYMVESVGTSGNVSQVLQAYIHQTNFGHYAYFTNYDPPAGWWVVGLNSFNGPMHSNDTNNGGTTFTPTNILWYNNKTTNPMFEYLGSDAYTVSASSIDWNVNTIGTKGSPTTTANWSNIAAGGSSTVQTGTPIIPLPTISSAQLNAALGTATAPSTIGAIVPNSNGNTTAGVYFNGNVNNMTLSVSNNTTQIVTVTQTDTTLPITNQTVTTVITMNQSADTTTITTTRGANAPTTSTYSGLTNGVVYVNGAIGSNTTTTSGTSSSPSGGLSGTVADNYTTNSGEVTNRWGMTIATPSGDNTNIDGSIKYNTQPTSSSFATNAGTFGLVSGIVQVTQKTASGGANNAVTIDGAVMASNTGDTGTFQAANYTESTGTFTLYGSYIADQAGIFGGVNLAGTLLEGLAENYSYDARLGNHPPPFFPTTGDTYTVVSWKMVPGTIDGII